MFHFTRRNVSGFTLTEMAIVLAVVGVLAAGLWNILSGANTQVRDEASASQQQELMSATKTFLASFDGNNFMANNPGCGGACGVGTAGGKLAFPLPLPTVPAADSAACTGTLAPASMTLPQATTWCSDLPPGFDGPNATPPTNTPTTNSYGQTYAIQVLRDATNNASGATPPNTYSFMIMTSGGDTITDTSGARISSLIGADGGFIYSATGGVCGSAPSVSSWACGAYGSWATTPNATYGFAAASVSGTIASRTYYSPQQNLFDEWLARIPLPGDSTFTYNTMTVPEYLGGQALVMGPYSVASGIPPAAPGSPGVTGADLYMGTYGAITGGGNIDMQGGNINFINETALAGGGAMNVQGGTINMNSTGSASGGGTMNVQGGTINLGAGANGGTIFGTGLSNISLTADATTLTSMLTASVPNTVCTMSAPGTPATCPYAITTTTEQVTNLLTATSLYAGTFIYTSSDRRLKKDIHPVNDTLPDIMRLNPVSFDFKSNDKKGMGFIAQDIEKVYPELVVPGLDGMKAVNYEGIIAPLVASVQELKKENDELRQRLQLQEVRQEKLERELQERLDK